MMKITAFSLVLGLLAVSALGCASDPPPPASSTPATTSGSTTASASTAPASTAAAPAGDAGK